MTHLIISNLLPESNSSSALTARATTASISNPVLNNFILSISKKKYFIFISFLNSERVQFSLLIKVSSQKIRGCFVLQRGPCRMLAADWLSSSKCVGYSS